MNPIIRAGRQRLARLAIGFLAASTILSAPSARAASEDVDPVFVFNRICYAQVPKLDQIRDMARRLAWREISGDDLKKFTVIKKPDVLQGWDAQVGQRLFRVAIVQSEMNAKMRKTFPKLGNGKATTCMLVLDDQHDVATFTANMRALAGKEPVTRDVTEGDLKTTTWAGGNAELKVFLISKANGSGRGGLLSVTVLTKAGFSAR